MPKILLIEDDKNVLENLSQIFKIYKYDVFVAENGHDGVNLALKKSPDIIICDIMMPGMDGYEVLKTLRAEPSTFAIPFLFLTARADKDDQRFGMELGADDYITKPFGNREILSAVESRLQKHIDFKKYYESKLEKLRSSLTTTIPHEFRTPLNSILGFAHMLKNNYKNIEPKDIEEMLSNIYESGERLLRLVINYTFYASLLDISLEGPNTLLVSKHTEFEIGQQAENVSHQYKRRQDLELQLVDATVKIKREHLLKIVEEIADNAFKFSNYGTKVKLKSEVINEMLTITILNNGRGMSPEQIRSVGAFMQFDRKDFEQQGAGLGLTIVKKISELYNGKMDIESIQGEKTKITISIPLA